jgi:UDP-N-acetyl-D-mannosaminuronate dehydrogenase
VERTLGQTFRFVELANDVNEHMPDYVVRRVQALLNDHSKSVKGSKVLVFGLAYKADTSDARETPSRPIIAKLQTLGAQVQLVDPHVGDAQFPEDVDRADGTQADLENADLILYLVDHSSFDREMIASAEAPVLDCRKALKGDLVNYL